jgi:glucose/arabinose dehydrogenase
MHRAADTPPVPGWNNASVRPWVLIVAFVVPLIAIGGLILGIREGKDELAQDVAPPAGQATGTAPAEDEPNSDASARVRLAGVGRFNEPLYVTAPPQDRRRVFVVEKNGRIRVIEGGKRKATPFLDISGEVSKGGEQGLLSMAFAPDYATSGLFYVSFTDRNGDSRIQEFKRSSSSQNRADKSSRRQVLFISQPFENHNGGLVLFGPDKLLYIGMGDGGAGGDPDNRAQNLDSLLGKMLRIDPRQSGSRPYSIPDSNPFVGRGGRDEIYAYGLRNPWRFSFDRRTGDMYIGDVGQDAIEEIDFGAKGANYGWSCFEGTRRYDGSRRCSDPVGPIKQYSRSGGACSVTGGVVVRDPALGNVRGRYVYGDFCRGQIRSFKAGRRATGDRSTGLNVEMLSSFGEDARGRVYVTSLNGPVYRLRD